LLLARAPEVCFTEAFDAWHALHAKKGERLQRFAAGITP